MNNFAWSAITHFRISGTSQAYFDSFKGCYKCGYYCREHLYSQISLKVWDSEETLAFSSRQPLRRHIAQLGTFSVNPGILVSLYASAHHPYTTLATGEWMIFWPNKESPIEIWSTECSHHLVIQSFLHVRLPLATLQCMQVTVATNATKLQPCVYVLKQNSIGVGYVHRRLGNTMTTCTILRLNKNDAVACPSQGLGC